MGATTGIGWTDSTINFWWGCTEVGPGCDGCYARIFSQRLDKAKWGDNEPRLRTSKHVWDSLDTWERKAIKTGVPIKVFCSSMADFFENHPDVGPWRTEGWARIKRTPHLRYQILTKRVSNIPKMLPPDWGPDYAHVGFMITVVNDQEAERDVPRLMRIKRVHNVTWVGLSVEPMLGRVDLTPWLPAAHVRDCLDWVVIGGESEKPLTTKCREYDMDAALALLQQVQASGCAVFHKQLGSVARFPGQPLYESGHWKGEIQANWPAAFQVQEFPQALLH